MYISAPGYFFFETPYVKENTYRYSYTYNIEKKTFSPTVDLYYVGDDVYEVRYEYVFENNPRNATKTGRFIYTQNPPRKLELIYPDPTKNLSMQQGHLKVRMTDGTLMTTHFHYGRTDDRICTKYGLVNGVWGHYMAHYLYNSETRQNMNLYVLDTKRVDGIPYGKNCEHNVVISKDIDITSENYGKPIVYHTFIDYSYNEETKKITQKVRTSYYTYSPFVQKDHIRCVCRPWLQTNETYFPVKPCLGEHENTKLISYDPLFPNSSYILVYDFVVTETEKKEIALIPFSNGRQKSALTIKYTQSGGPIKCICGIYLGTIKKYTDEFDLPPNKMSYKRDKPKTVHRIVLCAGGVFYGKRDYNNGSYNIAFMEYKYFDNGIAPQPIYDSM